MFAGKTVGEREHYTRIGVALPLEKGGFNILFDALPTNGRVLLLPERERSVGGEDRYRVGAGRWRVTLAISLLVTVCELRPSSILPPRWGRSGDLTHPASPSRPHSRQRARLFPASEQPPWLHAD